MFAHDGRDEPTTIPVQLEILQGEGPSISELVQFNIHVIQFYFRLDHHSNITLLQGNNVTDFSSSWNLIFHAHVFHVLCSNMLSIFFVHFFYILEWFWIKFLLNLLNWLFFTGNFTVPLNSSYISIASNADKSRIVYQVTREPQFGRLRHVNMSRPGSLRTFTQTDIDKRQIVYEQTLLEGSEDLFTLDMTLKNREENAAIRNKTVHITIQPLTKLEQVIIPVGQAIPLTVAVLDAEALRVRAKVEPSFQVIQPPKLGTLVWAGEKEEPVSAFTQTDITEKKVRSKIQRHIIEMHTLNNITLIEISYFEVITWS